MPRRKTEFAPGQYYHIYNRGVGRQPIFLEKENYLYSLQLIKKYTRTLQVAVIAYCLMPNHYHLLVRQDGKEAAGRLPQYTFNAYTKAFNRRHHRTGTLFEGRYQSVWVKETGYLYHLCRYIHANPVKAGLVTHPSDWAYSNYLEWIEMRHGALVDHDFIAENFPKREHYRQFVMEYLTVSNVLPRGVEPYLLD